MNGIRNGMVTFKADTIVELQDAAIELTARDFGQAEVNGVLTLMAVSTADLLVQHAPADKVEETTKRAIQVLESAVKQAVFHRAVAEQRTADNDGGSA